MMRYFLFLFFILPFAASAQNYDQSFKDWSVFTFNNTCYIGTAPIRQAGNYSKRGQPYVLVVHRGGAKDEINVSAGYPFKTGKDVQINVDSAQYQLFSKGEVAWAYDELADRAIVSNLKSGTEMVVDATSEADTNSKDTYSLIGFTAAYNYMKQKCR